MKPKFIIPALLLSMLTITALASDPGKSSGSKRSTSAVQPASPDKALVKFIGSTQDHYRFEIHYNQAADGKSTVKVQNAETGGVLFREAARGSTYRKIVNIPRDEFDKVEFVIDHAGGSYRKAFHIVTEVTEKVEAAYEIK